MKYKKFLPENIKKLTGSEELPGQLLAKGNILEKVKIQKENLSIWAILVNQKR